LDKIELPQYRAGKLRVYTVNGQFVRDNYLIDFTQGGHFKVYPEFIPKNEIWLDNNLNIIDRKATLLHELAEMKGWQGASKYSEVHNEVANPIEAEGRRNVGEMDDMIDSELQEFQGEPVKRSSAYPVTSQINRARAMVRAIRRKAQAPKEDEPIPDNVYRGHKLYTTVSGATKI